MLCCCIQHFCNCAGIKIESARKRAVIDGGRRGMERLARRCLLLVLPSSQFNASQVARSCSLRTSCSVWQCCPTFCGGNCDNDKVKSSSGAISACSTRLPFANLKQAREIIRTCSSMNEHQHGGGKHCKLLEALLSMCPLALKAHDRSRRKHSSPRLRFSTSALVL